MAATAWLLAAALLYAPVLVKLAHDWTVDPTYSHGFLVPVVAAFLVWSAREPLVRTPRRPSVAGLAIVVFSLGMFVAGSLGAELFLTRISMIGVLAGTIVYSFGWAHCRFLAFPLAFLMFMIPLPSIVFDHATASLRLFAAQFGEELLRGAGVPVLRDGNVLTLANVALEVNDACSGARSLMVLLSMTTLVGYLFEPSIWRRVLVTAMAVPLAVLLNGARIGLTGLAAVRFGRGAAEGQLHEALGWLVFVVALGLVWGLHRALRSQSEPSPSLEPA